jgi:hypothetical protein
MVWGQVAPAVDLLRGLDEDALAGGRQAGFVKVQAGDVAQAAFRVGEQAQDAVRTGESTENGAQVGLPAGCPIWAPGDLSPEQRMLLLRSNERER